MQLSTSRVWFVLALFSLSILVSCDSGGGTPEPDEPSEVSVDVTGTVTSAENDEPIGGASIEILRADNDNTLASATTSSDGNYEATFTIEESETPNQLKVRVSAGRFMDKAVSVDFQSSVSRDVELQTGVVEASVSGVVADTANDDPIEGAVVAGVRPDSSEQLFETTTSGSGEYKASFEIEATSQPSDIVLSVNADGFESKELTIAFTEEVSKDVKLEAKTTEATASGLVDRSDTGDPVTNATVTGSPAGNSGQLFETTTNEAGEYEVTFEVRVPDEPDEIAVGASAEDFEDSEQTVSFGNEISADLSLSPSEVTVTTSGTITAELDDSTVEGAEVSIFPLGDNNGKALASTTSETGGAYSLSFSISAPDAPDELRLEASERRFDDTTTTVGFSESISRDIKLPSIRIGSAEKLQGIQDDAQLPTDGFYVQVSSIKVSNHNPIGDETTPFMGVYDGNGYSISGDGRESSYEIGSSISKNVGIFGIVGKNGEVKNVTLKDVTVAGRANIGMIAGKNRGEVSKSKSSGNFVVDSDGRTGLQGVAIGGIVGENEGVIEESKSNIKTTSENTRSFPQTIVGGLVGRNSGVVRESTSDGSVFARSGEIGGLVGVNSGTVGNSGTVEGSESSTTVSVGGEARQVGGLVGSNGGTIKNSSASGSVNGGFAPQGVGGLVGVNAGEVINARATGPVSSEPGGDKMGGLVGENLGSVEESYSNSNVQGQNSLGGLVGVNSGTVTSSLSEGSVTGSGSSIGGLTGKNSSGVIRTSYSRVKIDASSEFVGGEEVGGLVGTNQTDSRITESYSVGSITGGEDVGAVVGVNGGSISTTFWDKTASDQSRGVGNGVLEGTTGLTTSEMQGNSAEENMSSFDFQNTWRVVMGGYPALQWEE